MKITILQKIRGARLTTIGVIAAAAMVATNSTVNVLSVHAQVTTQNNEIQKLLSNIEKESKRRSEATSKAKDVLNATTTITPQAKTQVLQGLEEAQKATDATLSQAKGAKDIGALKQQAANLDKQYDKYAGTQAQGMLLGDSDQQQQTKDQLSQTAKDIQTTLDEKKEAGGDTGDQQQQLDNIIKLIASIAAIVASIVTLVMALVAGDYAKASVIFLAIVGQLAQNLASILNVQGLLQIMISTLGMPQGGEQRERREG